MCNNLTAFRLTPGRRIFHSHPNNSLRVHTYAVVRTLNFFGNRLGVLAAPYYSTYLA